MYGTSLLFYEKGSKYQTLIHQLKYQGKKQVGVFLGKLLGYSLLNSDFDKADIIISVPLHKTKLRRRGFNQSDIIAKGISEVTGKPIVKGVLKRTVPTKSQTSQKRYARWENVEGLFKCTNMDRIKNKHVLLVDDVLTTGATLEAAGSAILQAEGVTLSVATTAFAN
jgi:ComF family protein